MADRGHGPIHAHVQGGVGLGAAPHWAPDGRDDCGEPDLVDPRPSMPALHGFIAGWGFGAFALIVLDSSRSVDAVGAIGVGPGGPFRARYNNRAGDGWGPCRMAGPPQGCLAGG